MTTLIRLCMVGIVCAISTTLPRAQKNRPVRVACVGDSITFGFRLEDRARSSYPARLGRMLGATHVVKNFGLSGAGVLKKAKRPGTGWPRDYAVHEEFEASLQFAPDIVIINLGINDLGHWAQLRGDFFRDYCELIRRYQALQPQPVVYIWHGLAPLFKGQTFYGKSSVDALHEAIGKVAKRTGVRTVDLRKPLIGHPEWFPDSLHPNESGARRIAEVVCRAIAPDHLIPRIASAGFEVAKAGPLRRLETEVGIWTAGAGHAAIDAAHRNSGRQCLHLLGGQERRVELALPKNRPHWGEIALVAERWTKRGPFEFSIEKKSGGRWKQIYRGDKAITVGGFLTHVRIPLDDPQVERLRIVCSSPLKSGVLIDDVQLVTSTPQRVAEVIAVVPTLPLLSGVAASPLLRIRVDVEGTTGSLSLEKVVARVERGAELLQTIRAFSTGAKRSLRAWGHANPFHEAVQIGAVGPLDKDAVFSGVVKLQPGANYIWIAGTIRAGADQDGRVLARCVGLEFSDGTKSTPRSSKSQSPQRMGVAVRKRGDDGVHTARIPGLARTNKGTLIAVYDLRHLGGGDLPGHIDVGMSRSVDGGRTWQPMRAIMDMGEEPKPKSKWRGDGIGDPAVLVDRKTDTIWVAAAWSHGNRAWRGSGPGLEPTETGQLMLVRSDDDGLTWSKPINITKQVKRPEWCYLLQGPGKGITMRDGTIVFAAQFQDTAANRRLPRSTILYSQDHGKTWKIGTGAFDDTTEAQVVESEPGVLMLNCRYNRAPHRIVMTTRDMGKTWQRHASPTRALPEPRACMASLIDIHAELGIQKPGWLLFSNPASTKARERITIQASLDRGMTWKKEDRLLLDEGRGAGYSCMTMIDEETVGILYEGSQAHLIFQRVKLRDIVNKSAAEASTGQEQKKGRR